MCGIEGGIPFPGRPATGRTIGRTSKEREEERGAPRLFIDSELPGFPAPRRKTHARLHARSLGAANARGWKKSEGLTGGVPRQPGSLKERCPRRLNTGRKRRRLPRSRHAIFPRHGHVRRFAQWLGSSRTANVTRLSYSLQTRLSSLIRRSYNSYPQTCSKMLDADDSAFVSAASILYNVYDCGFTAGLLKLSSTP